ncbi:MAG: hypothetical protein ABFC96_08720 [Thermoguttaceae bacterium]
MMLRFPGKAAVVAAMIALGVCGPRTADAAETGMLILRNGEVLEGRVTPADDVYVVDLTDGQIRVKQKDVEVVCRDLEDGYRRKRAGIQVGNVHHHLELAQWCLHHNLLGPAATELADATVADPRNPMIAVLQRRLKMSTDPQAPTLSKGPATGGPSNDDLDRMVRGLPQKAVETFTQSVQPVLLNNCTGSGCHTQADGELRLTRIPAGRPTSRRITQRNLYSVLKFVDRENPAASKLLTAAIKPHATAQRAVFDDHQAAQVRKLADWLAQLADQAPQEQPDTVAPMAEATPEEPQNRATPRVLSQEARRGQTHRQFGKTNDRPNATAAARPNGAEPSPKPNTVGAAPTSDPFDPNVFNRRYGSEKKPPAP